MGSSRGIQMTRIQYSHVIKPSEVKAVAVSGGVDSMALLNFLSRKSKPTVLFFNHGTRDSKEAQIFIHDYCKSNKYQLEVGYLNSKPKKGESLEAFWRKHRYKFLHQYENVVLAHHLDDAVETYVAGMCDGVEKIIPFRYKTCFRPILTTEKEVLINWCEKENVPWIEDVSNKNTKYRRNYIRHEVMPHLYKVNPGLRKVVRKKLLHSFLEYRAAQVRANTPLKK
jgi:tRNA(Ile)-lysidine synthetase-like protein